MWDIIFTGEKRFIQTEILSKFMNYQEYITTLENQTALQQYDDQLKFAVMISQKLYPDYQKFYEIYKWGEPELLIQAISVCQNAIINSVEISQLKTLVSKIDLIIPNMDDFGSELSSYALNASAAVQETLQFIVDKDKTHINNVATYYTDTIDFKIQEEKELTDYEIETHPVMIEAWNFILEQTKPVII